MRRRACALVKLLVALGVISVLLSILLPPVAEARRGAGNTPRRACLHAIGAQFQVSANESNEKPPRPTSMPSRRPATNDAPWLVQALEPYAQSARGVYEFLCGSASRPDDTLTAQVGQYDPPPPGIRKPRVGCPAWTVRGKGAFANDKELNDLAADLITTLIFKTDRFKVIERAQLQQLLKEQNLEGIAKPGQVRGVDFLLIGKVTNLSVKPAKSAKGFDHKDKSSKITTECGVDVRLVDPTSGEVVVATFNEYMKTDSIGAFGVDVLGAGAEGDPELKMDEDNKGKILRLALDQAVRKSLPAIDQFLVKRGGGATAPARDPQPAAAKKFCGQCGTPVTADAKFCPKCGKPVQ